MRRALILSCLLPTAALAAPAERWLADPCALLETGALSQLYPGLPGNATLSREARSGRFESECLLVDKSGQRSLRLVLHPAKDAARVQRQLDQLGEAGADRGLRVIDRPAALSAQGDSLSWAEAHWMLTLAGSERFERSAALALAERISRRVAE